MPRRPTNARAEVPFDDLRRNAVQDPSRAEAYGHLLAQHFGAVAVERLRAMTRWVDALVGKSRTMRHFDQLFVRVEQAQADRRAVLGSPKRTHTIKIAGRRIHFVRDDPATERFIATNLIAGWPYEAGVMRYLLARLSVDDVFVDVGAHAGFFSLIATALGGVAYAIEPQRELIRVIERNAVVNGADRLHALRLAVSDRDGMTSMIRYNGSPGMQMHGEIQLTGQPTPQNRHTDWLPIVRLDTLFDDDRTRPQFVKIDVEGLEMKALAGATGLIERKQTAFIIELHPHLIADFGSDLNVLARYFGTMEWRVLDVSSDPPRPVGLAAAIDRAAAGTRDQDGRVTLAIEPAIWRPSQFG